MPQGNLGANVAQNPSKAGVPLKSDASGTLITTTGGVSTALNVNSAQVIKAGAGRVCKIVIIAPGTTSGAFTLNDSATTGGAAASNVLWTLPYNGANNIAGAIFTLDLPTTNGLVVSAVPGGGSPVIAVSFI